jgi:hypothetical protein
MALVVEDDALLLYSIAQAFRSDRWLVLEARSGEEAVAHLDGGERAMLSSQTSNYQLHWPAGT